MERDDLTTTPYIACCATVRPVWRPAPCAWSAPTRPIATPAAVPNATACMRCGVQFDPARAPPQHRRGLRLAILQHFRRRLTDERKPFQHAGNRSSDHPPSTARENFLILVSLFLGVDPR